MVVGEHLCWRPLAQICGKCSFVLYTPPLRVSDKTLRGGENDASVEDDARLVVARVQVNVLCLHSELARRPHVVLVHLVRVVAHPDRLVVRKQLELVIGGKVDRNIAPIC